MHEHYTSLGLSFHCIDQWYRCLEGNLAAIVGDEKFSMHLSNCAGRLGSRTFSLLQRVGDVEKATSEVLVYVVWGVPH